MLRIDFSPTAGKAQRETVQPLCLSIVLSKTRVRAWSVFAKLAEAGAEIVEERPHRGQQAALGWIHGMDNVALGGQAGQQMHQLPIADFIGHHQQRQMHDTDTGDGGTAERNHIVADQPRPMVDDGLRAVGDTQQRNERTSKKPLLGRLQPATLVGGPLRRAALEGKIRRA